MIDVLTRRKRESHTEGRACDDTGRDWSDAAASQGMPSINGHHQKLGRGKEEFYSESQREQGPADTLIAGFWPSKW